MPTVPGSDTDELIARASKGDDLARQQLLVRHRDRLRQMVAVRMDPRLAARVDPSDIVQEAPADATVHLSDDLRDRPMPFYVWLRRLAWERLVMAWNGGEPRAAGISPGRVPLGTPVVDD
jgi:RNA polymerase sigma-70 factor (ECF subfamily)